MASKLWPHILRPTAAARKWIEAGCTGVKCVGDFGASTEISPSAIIIGREISHFPDDPGREITGENLRHLDPIVAARFFVDVQREKYRLNPKVLYWEGVNEPQWNWKDIVQGVLDMQWYAQFERERIFLLKAIGLRAVIGNFSTGIPDIGEDKLELWQAFLPALRAARDNDGILGLHEYEDKPFSSLEAPTKDPETGAWIGWNGEGWNVFRCVKFHRLIAVPNNLDNLKVVLTEFGIPFRDHAEINYAQELIWADRQFRKYPWLLGACVYTFGQFTGWQPYNMEDSPYADKVAEYINQERNVVDMTLPPVDPDPIPPPPPYAQGVDVSSHQGTVDWASVAGSGISFAMIRVNDGLNPLDTEFVRNWKGAKDAGLVRGAYQFFRPNLDPVRQADAFLNAVGGFSVGDFPPCLDIETLGDRSAQYVLNAILIWVDNVRLRTGLNPIIYTSAGFWSQLSSVAASLANWPELWVAHWTNGIKPLLPITWSKWRLWQYTNKGSVTGITGLVDRDRYNGTVTEMKSYVNSLAPLPGNNLGELIRNAKDAVRRAQDALADVETILEKMG